MSDQTFNPTPQATPSDSLMDRIEALIGSHPSPKTPPPVSVPTPVATPAVPVPTPQKPEELKPTPPIADGRSQPLANSSRPTRPRNAISLGELQRDALIMIVDDEEVNLRTVKRHLELVGYANFVTTNDAREAFEMVQYERPDVVLLDINMPHVTGLDILKMMKNEDGPKWPPVVVLTAATDAATKRLALDLGAADFLTKPIDPNDLIPRVRNTIAAKLQLDQLAQQAAEMEKLVEQRTAELIQSRQQLILSLAKAAEHRDNDTSNHVLRVGHFAAVLAKQIGWPPAGVEMIRQAAQLHDVGKIGIPDAILFKPGKLDEQEYDLIKTHCAIGKHIIEPLSPKDCTVLRAHAKIGENILHDRTSPMLMMASRIAQTHHERWDGTGYPLGLKGADIPVEGRITAIADVFDALSSKRSYKESMPREECFKVITSSRGTHFDPDLADAFMQCSEEIIDVQITLMDAVE